MASDPGSLRSGVTAALPYILTVAGGVCGVAYVNVTGQGSPVFGIVIGAILGRLVSLGLTRAIERKSAAGLLRPTDKDTTGQKR